jgi:hypothetical protein
MIIKSLDDFWTVVNDYTKFLEDSGMERDPWRTIEMDGVKI